jgi:cobaltochelatase, CobN subunit
MRIVNILCEAQDMGKNPRAVERVCSEGFDVNVKQYVTSDLDNNEKLFSELISSVSDTDLIMVRMHAGLTYFKKFERLRRMVMETGTSMLVESEMTEEVKDNRELFKGGNEEFVTIRSYIELGGDENEYNLLKWLLWDYGVDVKFKGPERRPAQGIYHPDTGITDKVPELKGPAIGILMEQTSVVNGNTKHLDTLIRRLKSLGLDVIPVFLISSPGEITGSLGINETVRKYMMKNGRPLIDVLVVTMGFSQINLSDPGDGSRKEKENIFKELNVPVIQTSTLLSSEKTWDEGSGYSSFEISMNVFWPEYDGQIISFPFASNERTEKGFEYTPIDERIDSITKLISNWSKLKQRDPKERKIAILLHQNPPSNSMIGSAFGLDAQESTINILREMKASGYVIDHIPENGQELTSEILKGLSNDTEWLSSSEMKERAAALVPAGEYIKWFSSVNDKCQTAIMKDWGKPPGTVNTVDGTTVIPGILNGNVFMGLQPNRGSADDSLDVYHSQEVAAPHNYLAYYRWISEVFKADAVIHMGTHGTLEWLPGKGSALSGRCFPDVTLGHVPHIYPYTISNPGEGMQAKRRSYATIVDHLIPVHARAGNYEDLADIESLLQEYLRAVSGNQKDKGKDVLYDVFNKCVKISLLDDIGLTMHSDIEELEAKAEMLYDYICDVKDNSIKDGLHVFGRPPKEKKLDEMIYSLTRLENGSVPSMRKTVASLLDIDLDNAMASPSEMSNGVLNGELVDLADSMTLALISEMRASGFRKEDCMSIADNAVGMNDDLSSVIEFICDTLVPSLEHTDDELKNFLRAMNGEYIEAGPSGCPTRGNSHLLPTGRNFYSIDPAAIPSRSSWATGVKMADQMIERHVKDNGTYPKQVGIVIWATDTMKTGGDDIAYVLWLLGIRPVWSASGSSVVDLEVVPTKELKRPRIDITLRISGLFRDSFPNIIELMDDAVRKISELDETDEENYLLSNLRKDIADSIANGMDRSTAERRSRIRIFGDPPGNYGGGVDVLIETSQWSERKDLGEVYVEWGGYGYGRDLKGEDVKEFFKKRLSTVDVTVKNHESRELDVLDNDDDYIFLGGMNAAVETYSGKQPMSMIGDSSNPDKPVTRTLEEESKFIFRSRVLNPKWVDGLKEHGYRGVQELSNLVEYSFGWDSTSDMMEDWMYQSMTEKFLFDGKTKEWIEENNPDALRDITSRLLEAIERGMWNADKETEERLRSMFLDSESLLEDINDR